MDKMNKMGMAKRGFTLLELIIVIIIIGVLATLGFTQYVKMVEKSRTAEAKMILGQIRSAQRAYFTEKNTYTSAIGDLFVEGVPLTCAAGAGTHYFSYTVLSNNATATRCTALGKNPPGTIAYVINVTYDGGAWGGTAGYF